MIVAPSLLAFDFTDIKNQIETINPLVDWLHFDVMDGNFVPNISFGPQILKDVKKISPLFMDAHLMVKDPLFYAEVFKNAGADLITFHLEATTGINECKNIINKIHELGLKAGISIKPKSEVNEILNVLDIVDLVLVMSVEPGFGGQKFIDSAYDKVKELYNLRNKHHYNYLIEVDGGVNDTTGPKLVTLGADVLVSGSYLIKGDVKENINKLSVNN